MRFRLFRITLLFLSLAPRAAVPAQSRDFYNDISGELMLRAFQYSFPGTISGVAFQDGDWTIRAGDALFYWAGGRLLPGQERNAAATYSPYPFEIYPAAVPSPAIFSAEYVEALRRRGTDEALRSREDQHRGFQAALYGGLERREIEARLVRVDFLGRKITVHRDIAEALGRIDADIRRAAAEDKKRGHTALAAFIASIGQLGAYNWREIHGTRQMSYHSWGLAVDILPKQATGQIIYWLWERPRNADWMLIPLEQRWKPPDRVIEAFEREGFIWGGKWPLYDNMHFEYRPELHELNRLLAALAAAQVAAQYAGTAAVEPDPAAGSEPPLAAPKAPPMLERLRETIRALIARLRNK